jgi:ADP-ribosylglycohydrolase
LGENTRKSKRKFLTGFKYIVSTGGDTDTNCAIFGAIFGYKKDITQELDIDKFSICWTV